ncbi:hypothetical protein [Streptomyces sp. Ag109_G2-15]|uniref:ATP dependent DNA ligase n=1 Tax=Streptomyces sp. Ag109_G2-15 TaxID=1938850 RepID=UPI00359C63A8
MIGGFTGPGGSRTGFGALRVGYYERQRLFHAGKVGTGYDRRTLEELRAGMDRLKTRRYSWVPGRRPETRCVSAAAACRCPIRTRNCSRTMESPRPN